MSDESRVRGLWCATLTPLDPAGDLDGARMTGHALALLGAGVDGVAPFGTTGEGPSFSVAERRSGLETLLRAGVAPRQMVVGTGCASVTDTMELTRHALRSGVSRCLILPPFFFKNVSDEAVYAFYAGLIERVADSRLRVYVYHIPQFSRMSSVALPTRIRMRSRASRTAPPTGRTPRVSSSACRSSTFSSATSPICRS